MDDDLCQRARSLVADGALPADAKTLTYGGVASGRSRCRLCGELIVAGQPEIELECNGPAAYAAAIVLHPSCHQAWLRALRGATDTTRRRAAE